MLEVEEESLPLVVGHLHSCLLSRTLANTCQPVDQAEVPVPPSMADICRHIQAVVRSC